MSEDHQLRRKPTVTALLALIVVALAVAVGGCGGSDSSTDSSESTGSSSTEASGGAEVESARAAVAEFEKPPTSVGITEPLKAKPAAGKKISVVLCNLPTCQLTFDAAKEAAERLGWSAKFIPTSGEPEDLNKKFSQAVEEGPDGIFISGFSEETYEGSLDKAKAAGIPVVTNAVPDAVEPPFIANGSSLPLYERNGEVLGNWIIADSGGQANVAVFNIPVFPVLTAVATALESTLADGCAECSVKIVDEQIANVGTSLPKNVVSTLQADPDINYLVFTDGNFAAGVPASLRGANLLEDVKITGQNASETNMAEIMNGSETAYIALSAAWPAWAAMDSFARHFAGEDAEIAADAMPIEILTKGNVTDADLWDPPNLEADFEELWHVK